MKTIRNSISLSYKITKKKSKQLTEISIQKFGCNSSSLKMPATLHQTNPLNLTKEKNWDADQKQRAHEPHQRINHASLGLKKKIQKMRLLILGQIFRNRGCSGSFCLRCKRIEENSVQKNVKLIWRARQQFVFECQKPYESNNNGMKQLCMHNCLFNILDNIKGQTNATEPQVKNL